MERNNSIEIIEELKFDHSNDQLTAKSNKSNNSFNQKNKIELVENSLAFSDDFK